MDDPTSTQASDLPAAVRQLAEAVHTLAAAAQRDPDALLTAEQVGELLGLSPRTLKDQAAARVFPAPQVRQALPVQPRGRRRDGASRPMRAAHPRQLEGEEMAYGELIVREPPLWRCRFKLPNGTWGSKSGFPTKEAAEDWGDEQEDQIRRSVWRDPREGEKPFDVFAEEWFAAVKPRLEPTTVVKYRSYLDNQLLPKWKGWPMVVIYHDYVEIEKWLSKLDENYTESSVASYFALFSTIMGVAADRAKIIPGNPCRGVRVGSGDYEEERLVASPVQILRAAMRLYERGLGLGGFTLCLLDGYTGARWGELVGQQRHEYDPERRRIRICAPLKEVSGKVFKGGSLAAQSGGATSHPSRRGRDVGVARGRRAGPRHQPGPDGWICRRVSRCSTRN
ncbi:hypothetical protein [Amycolatopsis sp. YIM 10]|uniref:hypothetical protein n=1 Tax=Amycolatopsis sp. YIM 10 TaxID=2653857 RepID=UPI001D158C49|nr:hypothetical protein [Amycolatopsis sp. YIM 10]